jgi:non-ribosomal peptide synthetase component F
MAARLLGRTSSGQSAPQSDLRRYDPTAALCPCVNERRFYLARHGSDWIIQRHVLREQGVAVAGPPLQPMIDPVSPDEIRQGVRGVLRDGWAALLDDPAFLRDGDYQAYAVLTMCRALYTLWHGTIASKPISARWALTIVDQKWTPLIAWALTWQPAPALTTSIMAIKPSMITHLIVPKASKTVKLRFIVILRVV